MKRSPTVVAAALLVGALAVLLVAWFLSGWADVRARQREVTDAPLAAAAQEAEEIAHELRSELARLVAREIERPYFHYQNLFHDPRSGSNNWNVAPSPLADGPHDELVLGYFQLDAHGKLTTPTINDEVPQLSAPRFAENQKFRDVVAATLVPSLRTLLEGGPLVATAEPRKIELDPNSYVQNSMPGRVYVEQNRRPIERTAPASTGGRVTITISPLEWRTLPYGGVPSLVAVRQVATPDGRLAQGFVLDRGKLDGWLAARPDRAEARLATGGAANTAEIVPGWHVELAPSARMIDSAAVEAAAIARNFLIRFVLVGCLAIALAAFVVLVVARAERLANERSQFAAAAAHELRTPLAGLQLYGDMLADGLGDPAKLRDYARRMSEEASRLGRVVSNVLGFSQLERGNLSVDAKPGRLGEALCELAERAEPALDRAGAVLELDVPRELEGRFDRDALARVVGNLLDNAEKYSRDAEDRTISLVARDAGDGVEVVVTDRGPGVAEAAKPRLFHPFVRGVTSDGPAGLGLGLALSQSLARAMGGELSYRASEAGAAFVLRLPQ